MSPAPEPALLCYCTCPDPDSARRLARALVDERLAACVNQLDGVGSTYRWEGRVTTDTETLLLIKTTTARLEAMQARLLQLHPYEVPELIAVPITQGFAPYLAWLRQNVQD